MKSAIQILELAALTALAVAQSPEQWSPAGPGDGTSTKIKSNISWLGRELCFEGI